MKPTLHRATEVSDAVGRTMEGIAYRYERPSRVSDDSFKSSYFEEIMRRADAKTLTERQELPVFRLHDYEEESIGTVTFDHSADEGALMFTAVLNRSAGADEVLEDETWRDVSVGFAPMRDAFRHTDFHGRITQRVEIRLEELSLAPNGTALHKGAEVLAVRAQGLETPKLAAMRRKLLFL